MSSRTVAVVLKAQVDDYVSQMKSAERHTTEVEKAARSATEQFRAHNEALTKVGVGMAAVGAAAAVGLAVAIKAASDYGAKMAQLQTLSHATQADMTRLSDAAMKQGTAFGYSATQVAEAEIELTKAGRDTAQILGGDLKGALALAAAGQLDVAKATQIAVSAVTQFSSTGATIPHVADLLAAGADKALGSVDDLGQGLAQGGLVASQMGLSIDDTVGTLSAFAQNALMGSDAGTSLKNMFLVLQSPTKQAQELLDKYNITAYDSQGAFVGITSLAGQLQQAFKDKSQAERDAALSTIFGSDAIRSANILYKEGASGIKGWIDKVDETGFAAAQAAGKLNSLQGDVQKLSAAFQTDLIKAGSSGGGAFRGIVQSATAAVEAVGDVPEPVMGAAFAVTTLVAGVGLLGGAMLIAIPKIAATKAALTELKVSGSAAAGVFGKGAALVIGVTAVASGFAAMAEHGTASAQQISLAGTRIKDSWDGVDELFSKAGNALNAGSGLKASLQELGNGDAAGTKWIDGAALHLTHLGDVYKSNEQSLDAMGQQLAALAQQDFGAATSSFSDLVKKYQLGSDETKTLLDNMPAFRDELIKQADAAHVSATDHNLLLVAQQKGAVGAKVLASAQAQAAKSAEAQQAGIEKLAGSASSAKVDVKALSDAIAGFGSVTLDARSAQRDFEKAVDDARAAAKKAGDASKDTTQADRDKQAALDGVAQAALATAAAFAKQPGGVKKAEAALSDGRKAFVSIATEMLHSKTKANDLADALGLIPENVKTAYSLAGAGTAMSAVDSLLAKLGGIPKFMRTQVSVDAIMDPKFNGTGPLLHKAGGGPINGPGPKGVDSVYAVLAPGEYVLTADQVDRMGGQGAVSAFASELAHFANGGPVGPVAQAQAEIKKWQLAIEKDEFQVQALKGKQKAAARERLKTDQGRLADAQDHLYAVRGGDVGDAQRKAGAAADDVDDAKATLDQRTRAADAAKTRADAAQKAYEKAQDAAQKITGKGTADEKHDAQVHVKELQRAAQAAKKRQDAADKQEDTAQKGYDDAKDKSDAARSRRTDLTRDREDFLSAERRDPTRATTDPLSYVDQLRDMSRDDNFSAKRQKQFDDAANQYEQALSSLTKQASDAADNLSSLKDASKQMHDSVQQAIAGGYSLSGASISTTSDTDSGWVMRDGIRFRTSGTTTTGPSASSIAKNYAIGATRSGQFADALQQLAGRGLSTALLAELAQMGTEEGLPIAQAILAGSDADLQSINYNYGALGAQADRAGTTVADSTYAQQIAAADAKLAQINTSITEDGTKLRHLIAQAFNIPGYATGTIAATQGMHWVGEHGPELVGLRAGTPVSTPADSARWVRGGSAGGSGGGGTMRIVVEYPGELAMHDADGLFRGMVRTEARGVAQQEIQADAAQDAVLMMGGAA